MTEALPGHFEVRGPLRIAEPASSWVPWCETCGFAIRHPSSSRRLRRQPSPACTSFPRHVSSYAAPPRPTRLLWEASVPAYSMYRSTHPSEVPRFPSDPGWPRRNAHDCFRRLVLSHSKHGFAVRRLNGTPSFFAGKAAAILFRAGWGSGDSTAMVWDARAESPLMRAGSEAPRHYSIIQKEAVIYVLDRVYCSEF